jgi:hypothetical protein
MIWAECVKFMGPRNAHKLLSGEVKRVRSLGAPGHRLQDNIKMHCREMGFAVVNYL